MILLLGGSGYVGQAYQRLFTRLGVPFRNLARKEVDYTERPPAGRPAGGEPGGVPHQRRRLHRQAQRGRVRGRQGGLPVRQRRAAGAHARGVREDRHPWGHVSSGCIYTGDAAGRRRFPRGRRAEFFVSHEPLQLLQRDQGAGRGSARRGGGLLCLAAADSVRRGGQPAQLSHEGDALRAAAGGGQFAFAAGRVLPRDVRVLAEARALRDVQRHQSGAGHHARGRGPHPRKRGDAQRLRVLRRRGGVHAHRRQDAAFELRAGHGQAPVGGHRHDRGTRGRRRGLARVEERHKMSPARTLLVTGGAGFIGSNFVRHVLAADEPCASSTSTSSPTRATRHACRPRIIRATRSSTATSRTPRRSPLFSRHSDRTPSSISRPRATWTAPSTAPSRSC